jgi:NAD(P)-dependent dehydrogenase (short-subunit alcohol dehydrogenase family)
MDRMEGGRFKEKVAIVTGAASGMGREIALRFAKEGALVAMADINLQGAEETQKLMNAPKERSLTLRVDVSSGQDVKEMVKQVVKKFGKIDILINDAAISLRSPLLETSEEDLDRVVAVDLKGVFLCTKYSVPELIKAGGGKIVNISSMTAMIGLTSAAYTAAKGGVISLTRLLAGELGPHGINVNTVCPGFIHTPMSSAVHESKLGEIVRQRIPLRRAGKPADVATVVLFLASEDASYLTGTILPVDGGVGSFLDFGEEYRTLDLKRPSSE